MAKSKSDTSFFIKLIYFFPIQLLLVHLKKNQQLLLFWLILFLAIFKQIGVKYGMPYLFLAPEYLGSLSFASYFIVGFALGGFVIAFNISSYVMNGFRFPFLATLSKPFLKYSVNNSIIPLGYIISYCILTSIFLHKNEDFTALQISYRLLGFLVGYSIFVLSSMFYFISTNKSFEKLFGKELSKILRAKENEEEPVTILLNKKEKKWYNTNNYEKTWRVESYINTRLKFKLTRSCDHYDEKMLTQVFRQNHINASIFQFVIIASILLLGIFKEYKLFIFPASATLILVFTMLLMFTSAIRSWIRGWTVVVIIALLLLLNQFSKWDNLYYKSKAYGLSYKTLASYPPDPNTLKKRQNKDFDKTIKRLENWKKKQKQDKPKAVFIAASGGGARASFWSFLALSHLDSLTNGQLTRSSIVGTGSSGGMIGMSYFRELKLRQHLNGLDPYSQLYKNDLSKDLLNPVIFTLAVNDALIKTQTFEENGEELWKDRGYIFEQTLHENTNYFMDKRLGDYQLPEREATIPQLIFTPSMVNDGRRMLVSTLPLSFMCRSFNNYQAEYIDYHTLLEENDMMNLKFSTLLRMNSSFPYIMPTVSLPTDPKIDVFDSGLRDNYGIKTTLKYIFSIREWLQENTSGVIILQIRDGLKHVNKLNKKQKESVVNEVLSPFGSLYGNWFDVQDFNNDEILEYTKTWFDKDIEVINYQLNKTADNYISLNWHLTSREKRHILSSLQFEKNKEEEERLIELLK